MKEAVSDDRQAYPSPELRRQPGVSLRVEGGSQLRSSVLSQVQHMTKILVGLSQDTPGEDFIQTRSLVNCISFYEKNKQYQNVSKGLYESSGDQVETTKRKELNLNKSIDKTRRRKSRSLAWKAYARKEQESCNYSYRLRKAEQRCSGLSLAIRCCLFSLSRAQPKPLLYTYFAVAQKERCFLDRVYLEAQLICSTALRRQAAVSFRSVSVTSLFSESVTSLFSASVTSFLRCVSDTSLVSEPVTSRVKLERGSASRTSDTRAYTYKNTRPYTHTHTLLAFPPHWRNFGASILL